MNRSLALQTCLAALIAAAPVAADNLPVFVGKLPSGTIAYVADGDFAARTYADGVLAPPEGGFRDLLGVISIGDGKVTHGKVVVSNSVTAAPEVLALTPDGRTAFVTERLGQRGPGATMARELPPGNRLFAIDLSDKAAPKLVATAEIAPFPEALALSPDGRQVAVVSNTPEASLVQIVPFEGGRFGPATRLDLKELGVAGSGGPGGGVSATNVHWHPSGRILAINLNRLNRVVFLERVGEAQGERWQRWGETVEVGRDPFVGRFTPDGRHYITANWGRDFDAKDLVGRVPTAPSTLSVIRLAEPGTTDHRVVATSVSDRSSEGIAISPDGRLVATINMRDTALDPKGPRFDREGTVSLLQLDPESGALTKLSDTAFEGVLPEGGAFDLAGEHFFATVFQGHAGAGPNEGPGIEVFRVKKGARPALKRLGRIPLPHGVHHVAVSR